MRSTSLGAMIRGWRDRAQPPSTRARRRAPGLRREELAERAGLSVDYIVRLEQGRATHPSAQVVAALARALELTAAEKAHLHQLAGVALRGSKVPERLTPGVERMLERLNTPAAVFSPTWTYLRGNPEWVALLGPDHKREGRRRNLLWRVFMDTSAPILRDKAEHDAFAARLVADLRSAAGRYSGDDQLQVLIDELLEGSAVFASLWKSAHVELHWATKKTVSTHLGPIEVDCDVLTTAGDLRLVLYTTEAGSESERRLQALVGRG